MSQSQGTNTIRERNLQDKTFKKICIQDIFLLQKPVDTSLTLVWLHIHVWSGPIVAHRLSLAHCHLILHWHALWRWHWVIIATHGPVATWRHIHGTVCHIELVRSRSLHRHMVGSFRKKNREKSCTLSILKAAANSHTELQK